MCPTRSTLSTLRRQLKSSRLRGLRLTCIPNSSARERSCANKSVSDDASRNAYRVPLILAPRKLAVDVQSPPQVLTQSLNHPSCIASPLLWGATTGSSALSWLLSSPQQLENSESVKRPARIDGTPKRSLEHCESTFQFQTLFDGLGLLVFDECNRLVEMGGDFAKLRGYLNPHHTRRTCVPRLPCHKRCWTSWVRCATNTLIFLAFVRGGCHSEQCGTAFLCVCTTPGSDSDFRIAVCHGPPHLVCRQLETGSTTPYDRELSLLEICFRHTSSQQEVRTPFEHGLSHSNDDTDQ